MAGSGTSDRILIPGAGAGNGDAGHGRGWEDVFQIPQHSDFQRGRAAGQKTGFPSTGGRAVPRLWNIPGFSWNSDGRRVLSCSTDKAVRIWDIKTVLCERVLEGHTGSVRCVSFNPDGNLGLSGGDDATIRLWDLHARSCIQNLQCSMAVTGVAWSADQHRAFSGDIRGAIYTRDFKRIGEFAPFGTRANSDEVQPRKSRNTRKCIGLGQAISSSIRWTVIIGQRLGFSCVSRFS
ncbi:MAG: hypothetical protein ACKV19_09900 [Verrucomicrobiales bacterium]